MIFKNVKTKLGKSLDNDISLRIYSLILSIIVWFFVSATLFPNTTMSIKNVPLDIELSNSRLSMINHDTNAVTVKIEGNRAEIGNLSANDLKATAVTTNITEPGKYQLAIKVTSKTGKSFDVITVKPSTVEVELDKYISKEVQVKAEAPNASAAEGFIKGDPVAFPSVVNVTGPESQVNKITHCVVKTDYGKNGEKLKESYEVTSGTELILYNDTTVLNSDDFKIDKTNFSVKIPISMEKTLPFKLNINNIPPGFPIEDIKYTLDTPEITVAAPNDAIQNVSEIYLGDIDLRELEIGLVKQFPVTLPEGYQNMTGVQNVTVTFNSEGLATKKINIPGSSFTIINSPLLYDITPITSGYSGVTFVGSKDIIEKLTIQDIVTQVDMSSINIQSDDYFNAPVSIYVPDKGYVWALGNYTATFRPKAKK